MSSLFFTADFIADKNIGCLWTGCQNFLASTPRKCSCLQISSMLGNLSDCSVIPENQQALSAQAVLGKELIPSIPANFSSYILAIFCFAETNLSIFSS